MSESLWISTAYIQFPQQPEQFSALLGFARDREDFKQIIADTLSHQDITCRYQLAPLEAETFFQRHGKRWLLNKVQNLLPGQIRVIPIPIENLTAEETAITATDYLLRYEILDVVPLDRQFGRSPKRFAPDEIFKLLWPHLDIPPNFAEPDWKNTVQPSFPKPYSDDIVDAIDHALFGEPLPELKCYMVFDAKQHKFWHPENFKCRCENLFQGAFGEETKDIAPYLVEVIPYPDYRAESELMGIFSNREALTKFNWYEKSGIFIHSRHDFDTVYQHLRHFPMIKDEREEWSFFRFYDPLVLRQYLEVIATHPEKLSKFFGYDKRIIHAFASGYDSSFHYYSLKALPKVVPAPIVLTDWESQGLAEQRWQAHRQDIAQAMMQDYPQVCAKTEMIQLLNGLDEAFKKGYTSQRAVSRYALAKIAAGQQLSEFYQWENQCRQAGYNAEECALLLQNQFIRGGQDV